MRFIVLFWFLQYSFTLGRKQYESHLIDYYENLITSEIQKAFHYKLPTSAKEFKPKLREDESTTYYGHFDFIVVGSGPGGAVVANRLSEIKEWKILLIEAGGPETNFSTIPGMHVYLQCSRFNWHHETTPQSKACLGMKDNRCPMPRGKCLGGSSSINGLVYSRGHRYDYERWANEGNPGWSYEDVLPYFIKSENAQIIGDLMYHGQDSYWNVKNHRPISKQAIAFVRGSNIAYPSLSHDFNGREEVGAFYTQKNNINQFRHSASKAFLEPVMNRPNLEILTHSYATKVEIDSETKTAIGVRFTRQGKTYFAKVNKEVVLSAGSIGSPQILMLSGIGPKQHLQKMKIPVVQDLPVGKSLYNHAVFFGAYVNTNSSQPEMPLREKIKEFLHDYGTLTIALNSQVVAFYQSKFESIHNYPDIEIEVNPSGGPTNFMQHCFRFKEDVYDALFKNMNTQTTMSAYVIVLRSRSFGKITLRSKDYFEYPDIDPNILDNDEDVERMYEGIQTLKRIIDTEPMQKINASLILADYPDCRDHEMDSKGYWICAIRLLTAGLYHESSTCKMGPNPETSVVNAKAKVHGVKGLRVVDASIMPFPLAGHTTAPTVMIGEKVSDYIKLEHERDIDPIVNMMK